MKNKLENAAEGSKPLASKTGTPKALKTDPVIKKKSSNPNLIKRKESVKVPNAQEKSEEKKEGRNIEKSIVNKKDNGRNQTDQKNQEKTGTPKEPGTPGAPKALKTDLEIKKSSNPNSIKRKEFVKAPNAQEKYEEKKEGRNKEKSIANKIDNGKNQTDRMNQEKTGTPKEPGTPGTRKALKTDLDIKKSSNPNSIKRREFVKAPNAQEKYEEKKEGRNKEKSFVNKKDIGKNQTDQKNQEKTGGLIFLCSGRTKSDCFHFMVMGLPENRQEVVQSIKPGLKLFLYDFGDRLLYGIYEATSAGGMRLEPTAFQGAFPAQVRFKVHTKCSPLPLNVFKMAIKENFDANQKFRTELSVQQVDKLIELFCPSSRLQSNVPARPTVEAPSHPHQSILPAPVRQPAPGPLVRRPVVPTVEAPSLLYQSHLPAPVSQPVPVSLARRSIVPAVEAPSFLHPSLLPAPRPVAPAVEAPYRLHQQTLAGGPGTTLHEAVRYYAPPVHKDLVPTQREAASHDRLSLSEKEYRTYGLAREHPVSTSAPIPGPSSVSASESYLGIRNTYYPYSSTSSDPHAVPSRRTSHETEVDYHADLLGRRGGGIEYKLGPSAEVASTRLAPHSSCFYNISGRAEVQYGRRLVDKHMADEAEAERFYPAYSANPLSDHSRRQQRPVSRAESESLPVSSRYAFAGATLSYR